MRIAVMGTGGVGGYFGARLAQAGQDVHFIARGRQLAALREHGLRVESPRGHLHLRELQVTDDPASIGSTDLVIFGVKLWDTEAAAAAIRPLVGEDTAVISFQNGVVKDDILKRLLGERAVAGGVGYIAATIAEPGLIRHTGAMQKLVFGEYDGRLSERLQRFAAACAAAGIDHELSPHIRRTLWEKFVFLVGLSGTTATARVPIGPIRKHPQSRAFLHDLMDETVQVARAEDVDLPAGFADDRLAFCDQLPATMTSSMHHDLQRGSRLELPWLSGDVVARGRRLGVATPCNRAVFDLLSVHTAGAISAAA
jgi:2-dehydropantoate 2-reductase